MMEEKQKEKLEKRRYYKKKKKNYILWMRKWQSKVRSRQAFGLYMWPLQKLYWRWYF